MTFRALWRHELASTRNRLAGTRSALQGAAVHPGSHPVPRSPIRTALRLDIAPEDAVLRQARLGRYGLIVIGVGRPAGKTLYFGKIAAAVLENSQHSILFVSS